MQFDVFYVLFYKFIALSFSYIMILHLLKKKEKNGPRTNVARAMLAVFAIIDLSEVRMRIKCSIKYAGTDIAIFARC